MTKAASVKILQRHELNQTTNLGHQFVEQMLAFVFLAFQQLQIAHRHTDIDMDISRVDVRGFVEPGLGLVKAATVSCNDIQPQIA